MTKHKLDKQVEDVLQHYGVKGMKWDVKRTQEQIDAAAGGGGDEEIDESLIEELANKMGNTVSEIKDSIKKSGMKFLTGIFGKSDVKYKLAKPNARNAERSKNLGELMKKSLKDAKKQRKMDKEHSDYKKERKAKFDKYLSKDMKNLEKSLGKQGYKVLKKPKNTKSLEERGYKVKAYSNSEANKVLSGYKKKGFKSNK